MATGIQAPEVPDKAAENSQGNRKVCRVIRVALLTRPWQDPVSWRRAGMWYFKPIAAAGRSLCVVGRRQPRRWIGEEEGGEGCAIISGLIQGGQTVHRRQH